MVIARSKGWPSGPETFCQPSARPTSPSPKAKRHSPLRFVQASRRNCGRGYSGRGTVLTGALPFHEANAGRRGNIAGGRGGMVERNLFRAGGPCRRGSGSTVAVSVGGGGAGGG